MEQEFLPPVRWRIPPWDCMTPSYRHFPLLVMEVRYISLFIPLFTKLACMYIENVDSVLMFSSSFADCSTESGRGVSINIKLESI